MMSLTGDEIARVFRILQLRIAEDLELVDGKAKFIEDAWDRSSGGGGITMTMEGGSIIEKGGVAFSRIEGEITELMKNQMGMNGSTFLATGVSIVLHSRHPRNPIIHMNVRYFETDEGEHWFGGGIDLTPIYVHKNRAKTFHLKLKYLCDQFKKGSYEDFKAQADSYFFLPHRNESRGIGGVFFDHMKTNSDDEKIKAFRFCENLGLNFAQLYQNQLLDDLAPVTQDEINWQLLRRSRYVEFNLLHDRGTKFGLISNGRTESILLSMPPLAKWIYNFRPSTHSDEAETQAFLSQPCDWINCE